ncbi:MAG TPA: phospho-N-acetylmuramoyl-pentapeptide-transferase [Micrococcales bacterium]|uniref:Phospho-N-acetylmuramoyl-pentapeptide-transferase n=1 Tax=Miniimonas arenae TaxID=676201 RepID=A0A5C5BG33_9MICO|nr:MULTISPECIES: phospho-N-acetylmuramoyl-pentapeptide-transferase [Miniimonas]TNU77250.1 phospho-N-acetylmuramoyl-pentapeptide-transferase [Miniimonas arenae]HCX86307.1 phospho-N-acetylmuramoyl-pentapeptide-transferase [Micrococcales bacterium]
MIPVMVSGGVALAVALFGTPLFIRFLVRRQYGQFIRQDGPTAHYTKRGTPTMGGVVILAATLLGYFVANFVSFLRTGSTPSVSGLLLLFLMVGLGMVGFADDFTKISKQRSLGLSPIAKILGQGGVGVVFALLALQLPNSFGQTPASTGISFIRDLNLDLAMWGSVIGLLLFVVWANFLVTAWSNAVNLTDGLDGLATGVSIFVFGAYVLVTMWQFNQSCQRVLAGPRCYDVRDPLDLAIVTAAIVGACVGFLWWNASPAKIFMGDTGSLALGGALAGLSILTRTELLAVVIGGMFVVIVASSVIQIGFFKISGGRRVFRMAPLHHHFELLGWAEITIVIRFWLIAAVFAAIGVSIYYAEWIASA